ncbi:vWA domain-containing protein [Roseovarius aestuariivivens]|uniref:vWA domain-containing protein n=1 Tax=Roseovarius aestuariivivens TaxID=1888910 RepID=UPI001FDA3AC5|nr:vWA domain-containing protein [Roseovarius aestuariivivens]
MRPALPFLLCLAVSAPVAAQDCARDAMLVLDGSASMGELGFDVSAPTRMEEARAALGRAMPRIAPVRRVGLLIYGPGGVGGCSGVDLRFAPRADAGAAVLGEVERVAPGGLTPLAGSVEAAVEVLGRDGIVVLVTDGNETCGGRPCALGARLARERPGITVHVIGFRVVHDPFSWNSPEAAGYDGKTVAKCLPDATGGRYVDTQTVDELAAALEQVLGCAVIGSSPLRAVVPS